MIFPGLQNIFDHIGSDKHNNKSIEQYQDNITKEIERFKKNPKISSSDYKIKFFKQTDLKVEDYTLS